MNPDVSAAIIRAKILGALIRDVRLKAKKTVAECAEVLGVEPEAIEEIELGARLISLPELEILSYYLQTPLDHFWERETLHHPDPPKTPPDPGALIAIRQRMIGALIKQARLENGISREDLAQRLNLSPRQVEEFELGTQPIPVPVLESVSGILNRSIREFQDKKGPVGIWNTQQRALQDFQTLPVEMQTFISKPVNRPYLDLAIRLSEMSVDRLRAVAEGLLEITY